MKKFVKALAVVCVVLMLASLVACASTETSTGSGDANADPIVGSWEYESGGYTYTFNADGTGNYDAAGTVMNFTYTTEGDTLSILYDGNTAPFETQYSIDGDKLNVIDSLGNDTIYIKK